MPHKGGKRKKTRTHAEATEKVGAVGEDIPNDNIPRSIVARGSKLSSNVREFLLDLRKLMGPHTAANLKERNFNRTKDYASVASSLGVTHLFTISQTNNNNIVMKLARFHNGPTLHFHVQQYSLAKQVRALQKRPFESTAAYQSPPLVVLNNFGNVSENHIKLAKITLHSIFPSINVKTIRLSECRRVVLFHYNKEDDTLEMRHYAIKASPVGVNRNVKKLLNAKLPSLHGTQDISEFLENELAAGYSDSEAEDEASKVELPDRFVGVGNAKSQQSAIKLVEIGPRAKLQLFKVEQGMCEGDILYHKFKTKSPEDAAASKAKIEKEKALKQQRRAVQEANVKRKKEEQETKKKEKTEKRELKMKQREESLKNDNNKRRRDEEESDADDEDDDDDDDAEQGENSDEEGGGGYGSDDNEDEDDGDMMMDVDEDDDEN